MRITIEITPSKSNPVDNLAALAPLFAPLLAYLLRPDDADARRARDAVDDLAQPLFLQSPGRVAPGEVETVRVSPLTSFAGERLHVRDDLAPHFTIVGCSVDGETQLVGTSDAGVPCSLFSGDARGAACILDACKAGGVIELRVRNVSDEPREFAAKLFGVRGF